jgi:ubiquinone/menaquinone biosynthesis C-methylase UbiE
MNESYRHIHHGMSSEDFLDADCIISNIGIKEGQTVLDVGCGEGHFSLAASNVVGDRGQVVAVDVHEASINILRRIIARENIGNVLAFKANVTKHIPVTDNAVDVCLMVNVLHGFALNGEISAAMREIVRVVKRHGSLAIVDFKKIKTHAGPPVSERLSPSEVEDGLRGYGFVADAFHDVGPYSYLILFIKRWLYPI